MIGILLIICHIEEIKHDGLISIPIIIMLILIKQTNKEIPNINEIRDQHLTNY